MWKVSYWPVEKRQILRHGKSDNNKKNKNKVGGTWRPVFGAAGVIIQLRYLENRSQLTKIENFVWQMHLLRSGDDFLSLMVSIPIFCQKFVSRSQWPLQKVELIFDWHMTSIAPTVARTIAATVGATVAPTIACRRLRRSSAQPVAATVAPCIH